MKKANIVSVKKVEEKNAVKVSDSLDFCHQSSQILDHWLVIIISVTSFYEKFLLFRGIKENEDRRETMEWTA